MYTRGGGGGGDGGLGRKRDVMFIIEKKSLNLSRDHCRGAYVYVTTYDCPLCVYILYTQKYNNTNN